MKETLPCVIRLDQIFHILQQYKFFSKYLTWDNWVLLRSRVFRRGPTTRQIDIPGCEGGMTRSERAAVALLSAADTCKSINVGKREKNYREAISHNGKLLKLSKQRMRLVNGFYKRANNAGLRSAGYLSLTGKLRNLNTMAAAPKIKNFFMYLEPNKGKRNILRLFPPHSLFTVPRKGREFRCVPGYLQKRKQVLHPNWNFRM